jgi:hypothetical protein
MGRPIDIMNIRIVLSVLWRIKMQDQTVIGGLETCAYTLGLHVATLRSASFPVDVAISAIAVYLDIFDRQSRFADVEILVVCQRLHNICQAPIIYARVLFRAAIVTACFDRLERWCDFQT